VNNVQSHNYLHKMIFNPTVLEQEKVQNDFEGEYCSMCLGGWVDVTSSPRGTRAFTQSRGT
jgi:hypothetical protein